MSDDLHDHPAICALVEQGYEIGDRITTTDGRLRVGIRSATEFAFVELFEELQDLVAGRTTLAEIAAKAKLERGE